MSGTDREKSRDRPERAPRVDKTLRAANEDREKVADALRRALDEGRLTLAEFDERVGTAYAAVTYADLDILLADLPAQRNAVIAQRSEMKPARVERTPRPRRRVPLALMILWTIWGSAVAINLTVWVLVSVMTGHVLYPWPIWVAGPSGAALLAVTVGVQTIRHRNDPTD